MSEPLIRAALKADLSATEQLTLIIVKPGYDYAYLPKESTSEKLERMRNLLETGADPNQIPCGYILGDRTRVLWLISHEDFLEYLFLQHLI
jgi:hypothetical protein